MKKIKIVLFEGCRLIVSFVLLSSSIVKANDPIGFAIKLREYFSIFPTTLRGIMDYLSLSISLLLITIEFVLGLRLLLGRKPVRTTIVTFSLICVMTIITSIIYFTNIVHECGCFGDAIHLTNGETLLKNIILLPITLFLMLNAKLMRPIWGKKTIIVNKYIAFVGFTIFIISNYYLLPYIDFRGYRNGINIRNKIEEQDIKQNKYLTKNTLYVYTNGKTEKSFHIDSLPIDNNAWKFIKVKNKKETGKNLLLEYDFHPIDINSKDISTEILSSQKPIIIVVVQSISDINDNEDKILHNLSLEMLKNGYPQYLLFVDKEDNNEGNFANLYANSLGGIATIDNTTAYTMTRRFPSIFIIRDGNIIEKISSCNFPKLSNITNFVRELPTLTTPHKGYLRIVILLLSIIMGIVGNIKEEIKNIFNKPSKN